MLKDTITIDQEQLDVYAFNTIVVGSGAAGLNAAARLSDLGVDVALLTEGMQMGTSRNTGSDKQTYYRLAESGGDSVQEMAESLYAGGAADLDIAFCEAAGSLRAFYHLVELGVGFPQDSRGVFTGYKTDHDPKTRATSAGPSTSRFMTEALQREVEKRDIPIFDGWLAVEIVSDDKGQVGGLLAVNRHNGRTICFACRNLVWASGGPAGIYSRSVFPGSQTGATGTALAAGVPGKNLTEWQYGLASVKFRWNLSGSYQQVIPRYFSTNSDGTDEREFLDEWFSTPGKMYDAIFLKGYQWPFDPRKALNEGSSLIDILVYNETEIRGRRVFLDFKQNPGCKELDFELLSSESYEYLERLGSLFGTPIERLAHINTPAIDLYLEHGIDLTKEALEIQVAAQHCNGGLVGDIWWQSPLLGFFPVGEANGSHGVYRPGGSALNSGQVGSFRAAQYISARRTGLPPTTKDFYKFGQNSLRNHLSLVKKLTSRGSGHSAGELRRQLGELMSKHGAFIRHPQGIREALAWVSERLENFPSIMRVEMEQLAAVLRCRDLLITQKAVLSAMLDYSDKKGKSRGSYLVYDPEGKLPHPDLDESFRFSLEDGDLDTKIQEIKYDSNDSSCSAYWRPVRGLGTSDTAFENVWKDWLNDKIII